MNNDILTEAWAKAYERYKIMRRKIASGQHPLDQPFNLDPADPASPYGTMQQLCQHLQLDDRYASLQRSVAAREVRLKLMQDPDRAAAVLVHIRAQSAARQKKWREKQSQKLKDIEPSKLG